MTDLELLECAQSVYDFLIDDNDDKWRKVPAEYFITLEEWREKQLKELDI